MMASEASTSSSLSPRSSACTTSSTGGGRPRSASSSRCSASRSSTSSCSRPSASRNITSSSDFTAPWASPSSSLACSPYGWASSTSHTCASRREGSCPPPPPPPPQGGSQTQLRASWKIRASCRRTAMTEERFQCRRLCRHDPEGPPGDQSRHPPTPLARLGRRSSNSHRPSRQSPPARSPKPSFQRALSHPALLLLRPRRRI
mmetsp:Transcript_66568/g.210720  ORF Transcript_66568/g.210720 Transcript_66568/m.210720 type:complete len:203 (-) Transcript_66568:2815-3423(-)